MVVPFHSYKCKDVECMIIQNLLLKGMKGQKTARIGIVETFSLTWTSGCIFARVNLGFLERLEQYPMCPIILTTSGIVLKSVFYSKHNSLQAATMHIYNLQVWRPADPLFMSLDIYSTISPTVSMQHCPHLSWAQHANNCAAPPMFDDQLPHLSLPLDI